MEFVHGLDTKPTRLIDLRDSADLSSLFLYKNLLRRPPQFKTERKVILHFVLYLPLYFCWLSEKVTVT